MRENDLKELLDIYEKDLCNRIFRYQLNNKTDVNVVFYKENLCHLLGLQHVYGKNKNYLGSKGYEKIKSGNVTRKQLKKHNRAEYNKLEIKLNHFHEIRNMMETGKLVRFYQYRTQPLSLIVADFVIYNGGKEYILHLFLKKENERSDQYSPTSFVVKSAFDKNREQFIKGQEYKKVTKFEIVELDKSE